MKSPQATVAGLLLAPYALLRLTWRPYSLLALAFSLVVASLPFLIAVGEVFVPVRALREGTASPAIVIALWQALAFAPAGFGHMFATYRLEVQHTLLSWYVPALRRGLLTGTVLAAVTVALALALLMARNAPESAAVAAFAIACYAFLAPGYVFDAAAPLAARVATAMPLIAVAMRPAAVAEFAQALPVVTAVVAFALAAALLPAIESAPLARVRPFRWSRVYRTGSPAARANSRQQRQEWRGTLATEGLLPWLRAATYESSTRFPLTHLGYAAAGVLITRLVNNPGFLVVLVAAFFMNSGLQLGERMMYPLSRVRRAQLAYVGTVVDAVTVFLLASLLLYLSWFVPLPRAPLATTTTTTLKWVLAFGCTFALAPIAQWGRIRWASDSVARDSSRMQTAHFTRLLVYLFSVGGASAAIEASSRVDGDLQRAVIAIALLGLATQLIHGLHLYYHFTKRDLEHARG